MQALRKIGLAGALVLASCLLVAAPSWGTEVFSDNFDDNALNQNYEWWVNGNGPLAPQEANHRLEMTIPAGSTGQDGSDIGVNLGFGNNFAGDCEVQIDFNLLNWPTPVGAEAIEAGIQVFSETGSCVVKRTNFGPSAPGGAHEAYEMNFAGSHFFGVATTDMTGKLKMTRTGNVVEGFFWKNNAWHLIGSIMDPQLGSVSEWGIYTGTWGVDSIGQTVKAAFDNYQLTNNIAKTPMNWTTTYPMNLGRYGHTATLLDNGKVLLVGGYPVSIAAELYDPATGTWSATGSAIGSVYSHTATKMANGKVLVAGGTSNFGVSHNCYIYNPATESWSSGLWLTDARYSHTATKMANGKVLLAGGSDSSGGSLKSAELYDLNKSYMDTAGSLGTARQGHTATLLPNGKVLVVGGFDGSNYLASAEIYDPDKGTWSPTGTLVTPRQNHTATLLNNGRVLIVGGQNSSGYLASSELYELTGTWRSATPLNIPRSNHTAVMLANGELLVAGGDGGNSASAEVYNPVARTWTLTGALSTVRTRHTAVALPNGQALVAGGQEEYGGLISAELFIAPNIHITNKIGNGVLLLFTE